MALKRYDLNIGKRMESIELPEEHVVQVIDGGSVSKITDIKQATLEAVRNPIGTQALSKLVHEGDKVALIVSDITRTWSRTKDYLPAVVEELNNSGIPDADIFVIIATGTHRDNDDEEKRLILGDALFARLQVFDHDALVGKFQLDRSMVGAQKPALVFGASGGEGLLQLPVVSRQRCGIASGAVRARLADATTASRAAGGQRHGGN